ncbi:MAG: type II/IV secretion system protein, partial [Desulfobacterales bacterium]|nr:type II/IV secretion system protein [Desulfobacterales bacterium]
MPDLDGPELEKIKKKINGLRKEVAEQEQAKSKLVSAREISIIKRNLSSEENVPTILDSASAFKDLGLYGDAVAEYEKLFQLDYPKEKVIAELTDCFFKTQPPAKVIKQIDRVADEQKLGNKEKAQIKFNLGQEMEKRDHKDIALDLYKEAGQLDPKDDEIKKRVDTVISTLSSGSRYDYLLLQKMVTTDQLQRANALAKKMKKSVEHVLIEQFNVKKDEIGKSFSSFYGCTFKKYDPKTATPVELLGSLKKTFLLHDPWVPLSWSKEGVEVLIDDPRNLNKIDRIRTLIKAKKINFCVAIQEDIEAYIKRFFSADQGQDAGGGVDNMDDFDLIPDVSFEEEEDEDDSQDEIDESSSKVVKLVDQVLIAAYRKNTSDIHVEPSAITKSTGLRFRVDGVCQEYLKVPNSMARGILSRLKIMANLDIAEKRLPQDGKIKFRRRGIPPFELRLATLPTAGGFEDAVLRILPASGAMKITDMALTDRNLQEMKSIIAKPYGLVLVVGPTGSGKTTSLHAVLRHINKPGIKIWTAEDPIEISQAGLRQVEARPKIGLDFARIMRSFLRADPDVIMIGEMRDEETASIGVEASLTGHLVFSTLHTNSAPETITRLLDMGLNALNFSDAFLGVMAQRLVRRLCKDCRAEYHPTEEEFNTHVSEFGAE